MPLEHAQVEKARVERAEAVAVLFPRWKTNLDLLKFWDDVLRVFPLEDVRAAARAHRINRGKADDPDLREVEAWCKNRRTEHVVAKRHATGPKPDVVTEEDRQWVAMMDLWRADYREAKPANPGKWVSDAIGPMTRDLVKFNLGSPGNARLVLRRIARECGAKLGTDAEAMPGGVA
jgi:hypothetical protein